MKINYKKSSNNSLPPFIILGDFNYHSTLWGCKNTNQKGKNLETFINNNNLCFYNNKSPTYLCPFSGSYSAIDLSLSDPSILIDFSWKVLKDTHGSDHFPICLQNSELRDEHPKRWSLNKANWEKFQKLCSEELKEGPNIKNLIQLTETLSIVQRCIPKNKLKTKWNRPWFNDKCKEAIRLRRKALREFEKEPTTENLEKFKQLRTKARKTKENKQESWKNYTSKLSSATKTKSVWDMIKKIAGKFHTHAIKHLSKNNNKITNKKDIADELAITYSKNSSAKNGNEKFAKFKQKAEKLKFLSDRQFRVRVRSTFSNLYKQDEGVPQGSILSVTLFNIKINSITKCLTPEIDGYLYVDDFCITARSKYEDCRTPATTMYP